MANQNTAARELSFKHPAIEIAALDSLSPNPKNARTHSIKQIVQVGASIEKFGFLNPLIVDENGVVLAGHGRLEAARNLGLENIPIIRLTHMSAADKRAYMLADNRLAELSGWDKAKRSEELSFLLETDYDFAVTGFELSDINFDADVGEPEHPTIEPPVTLPDPGTFAVSRAGDEWHIGDHRLIVGDARDPDLWDRLIPEAEKAAMIIADPPYNVPIDGHVSGLGKHRHREFAVASGEMSEAEFTQFLRSVFRLCVMHSADGSIHYHFMDHRHMREIIDAAEGVYTERKQVIVWNKTNASNGTFYRSKHELVFVFKSGKAKHKNNFGLGETGRYRTNVWDYPGANVPRKGRDKDLADHPTVKPVAMIADAILDCSDPGDIICDPFLGSGTTLHAAHITGRRGFGIEIDPLYADTIIRRMREIGVETVHKSGISFDDIAAFRRADAGVA